MHYQDYRRIAKTGDILLWSGKGHISEGIKAICSSWSSHISKVLVPDGSDMVLNWESTTLSSIEDIDTGRNIKGTQTVELSKRLAGYDGEVMLRRITPELDFIQINNLFELRRTFTGTPYEDSLLELFRAAYDGPMGDNKPNLKSVFCSELVAYSDMKTGLIKTNLPANEFTPKDYEFGGAIDLLMKDSVWQYGEPIAIEF